MLESMFYALLGCAVLFMILMIKWKSISMGILSVVIWFILAAGVLNLQKSYVAVLSDDSIVSGIMDVQVMYILSPLFMVIGIVVFLFLLTYLVLPSLSGRINKMM